MSDDGCAATYTYRYEALQLPDRTFRCTRRAGHPGYLHWCRGFCWLSVRLQRPA